MPGSSADTKQDRPSAARCAIRRRCPLSGEGSHRVPVLGAGSAGPFLEHLEVPDRVPMVLPLLLEDHLQAQPDALGIATFHLCSLRSPRELPSTSRKPLAPLLPTLLPT